MIVEKSHMWEVSVENFPKNLKIQKEKIKIVNYSKDHYRFEMELENKIKIAISVILRNGSWDWSYSVFIEQYWFFLKLKNGEVLSAVDSIDFLNGLLEELKEIYYKVIKELKNEPKYRLKLLSILNEDVKKVWDIV